MTRAVVTGAGSGLGRALCVRLAARGASVLAADVDAARADETARLVGGIAARCDVGVLADVEALRARAVAELGGVDLVVNNAGVAVAGAVGAVPIADWEWIVRVNLWGVVHGCHVFVPQLRAQGRGHVLNVASAAGLVALPDFAPYNVTKSAVVALSETLYAELRGTGVGVTVLCPTFFETGIARAARGTSAEQVAMAAALMKESSWSAEAVAERALRAVDRGRLYAIPQADGRWMWRLKRLAPRLVTAMAPRAVALAKRRLGAARELGSV